MRKFKRSKINRFICILLCVVLNLFPLNYLNVPKISAQGSGLKISILEVKDASGGARPWGKTATTSLTLSLMKYFEVVDRSKLLIALESVLNKKVTDEEISTLDRVQVFSAARAVGIDAVVYGRLLRAGIVKIKDIGEAQIVVEFYDTKKGHIINKSNVAVTTSERVGYTGAKELIIEEAITAASDLASSEAKKNYNLSLEGGRVMGIRQKGEEKIVLCDIAEGKIQKGGQLLVKRNGEIIGTLEVIKISRTYSEAQELSSVKDIRTGDNVSVLSNSPLVRKGYAKTMVEGKDIFQEAKPKKKSSLTKILIGAAVLGGIAYVVTQQQDKKRQPVVAGITGMPPAVANVKARAIELKDENGNFRGYGVEITWDKVTSDPPVVYYNVYRCDGAWDENKKVKIATIESKGEAKYIDDPLLDTPKQKLLEPTKQYSYKVTTVNNKGIEGTQPSKDPVTGATITGVAKDPTTGDETVRPDTYKPKPLAPEEVRVVSWGRNVGLSWKKVTLDEDGQIDSTDLMVSYKIVRNTTTPPDKVIKENIVWPCSTDTNRICFTDVIPKDISDDVNVYYAVKAVHPKHFTESDPSGISKIMVGSFPANVSINLLIDKPRIAANGESTAKLTAEVKELRFNTPAPDGVEVRFTTDSGAIGDGKIIVQGEPTKNYTTKTIQGIATATLTSSLQVGTAKIKAEVIYNTLSQGLPREKEIQFVGGSVEIVVTPLRVPADGRTFATITAMVKDANGSYIKDGTEVQWTTDYGYIKEQLQTTKGGKVQITVVSDVCTPCQDAVCKPEVRQAPATITATIPAQGAEKSVSITFTCLDISLSTTPSTILANGTSTSTIRAEVRDEVGNFSPDGTEVYFKAMAGERILNIDNQVLTKNGIANATLKSIKSNTSLDAIVEAIAGGKAFTRIVKLEPPEVGSITLYADPQITAPGKYLKIRAVVKDAQNYPLENREVTFTLTYSNKLVDGGMVSFSDTRFSKDGQTYVPGVSFIKIYTDSQGIADAFFTIIVPSSATVRATVAPKTAETEVKYAAISLEGLLASPNSILANGKDQSRVRVKVIDMTKSPIEPLSGASVRFATNKGTLTQSIVVTNTVGEGEPGIATTSLVADTHPGEATITVSVPCSLNPQITLCDNDYYDNYKEIIKVALTILGPFQITLSVNPRTVPADGFSTINLTAHLKDINGQSVIDGTNVFFVSSDEKSVISPYYSDSYKNVGKVTTKNGTASTTLRSSTIANQSVRITVLWWDNPSNPSELGIGKDTYPPPNGAFLVQTSDDKVEFTGGLVANISMAATECNIPGWDYLGVENQFTVYLSDGNNSSVKDETEVRFTTTCGIIEASSEYKKSDGCPGCGYSKDSVVKARYRSSNIADNLRCPSIDGKTGYAQIVVTSGEKSARSNLILSGAPRSIQPFTVPTSLPSGGRTQIIAKVLDINGNPVSLKDPFGNPRKVVFSSREGTLSLADVNLSVSGTCYDTNVATTYYTAPTISVGETKIDTITASAGPEVSASQDISISITADPPALAENFNAIAGNRLVQISFDPAPETDIASYTIHRGTTAGGPWTAIATLEHMQGVSNYQYNDQYREPYNLILNGIRYYYYIRVRNLAGQTSNTDVFPDIGVVPSGGRPSIPSNFVATSGDSQIVLTWAGRPQPDEQQITSYTLQKANETGVFGFYSLTVSVSAPPPGCYLDPTVVAGYPDGKWVCVDTANIAGTSIQFLSSTMVNGTTYKYRMFATNTVPDGGASPYTNVVSARALSSSPPAPPSWVVSPPATHTAGNRQLTLVWSANSESDLQGYYIERSCDGARFKRFATVGVSAGDITYVDRGLDITAQDICSTGEVTGELTNRITYYYRIVAYNFTNPPNFLQSDPSLVKYGTPTPATAPSAPPALTLTSGDKYISLSWGANNIQEAVTFYKIERNFANNCGNPPANNETNYCLITDTLPSTVRSYVNIHEDGSDFPVINGRNYTFKVYARNFVGWGPPQIANCRLQSAIPISSGLPVKPLWDEDGSPTRPVMLVAATGNDTRKVGVAFGNSDSTDVWGYYIYRSTSQTGNFRGGVGPDGSIGTIVGRILPITDSFDWVDDTSTGNPSPGQVYYYKVAAVGMTSAGAADENRISEFSDARPILTAPIPADGVIPYIDIAPNIPANLTVERIGSSAQLSWDRVDGESVTDILGYYVYRATRTYFGPDGIRGNADDWDGVLPPDTTVGPPNYEIRKSGGVDIIVPQPASGNLIYTDTGLIYTDTNPDPAIDNSTAYFYKVSAIRAKGTPGVAVPPLSQYPPVDGKESGRSNMASPSLTAPPVRPTWDADRPVVSFVDDITSVNTVQLTWQLNPAVAGYKVYRMDIGICSIECPYVLIGTIPIGRTPNNQFVDNNDEAGLETTETYFYRLKAYDVNGNESPFSDSVFAQVGLDDIILYTPENAQTLVIPDATTTGVLFEWAPVRGAAKYLIQVSSSSGNFDNQIYGYHTVATSRGIEFVLYSGFSCCGQALAGGTTYYWKVKAYDAHNSLLLTSETFSFTLVTP